MYAGECHCQDQRIQKENSPNNQNRQPNGYKVHRDQEERKQPIRGIYSLGTAGVQKLQDVFLILCLFFPLAFVGQAPNNNCLHHIHIGLASKIKACMQTNKRNLDREKRHGQNNAKVLRKGLELSNNSRDTQWPNNVSAKRFTAKGWSSSMADHDELRNYGQQGEICSSLFRLLLSNWRRHRLQKTCRSCQWQTTSSYL